MDCWRFGALLELVDRKEINRTVGKQLLAIMMEGEGIDPKTYVADNKLGMIGDTETVAAAIQAVLTENTKAVNEYKSGNQKVLGFLVGKIMKTLGGKADPQVVNALLMDNLERT